VRWKVVIVAATAFVVLPLGSVPARAAAEPDVLLVAMPAAQARAFLEGAALGLGVFPASRSGEDFLAEIAAGAPWRTSGRALGGYPGRVGDVLRDRCVRVETLSEPGSPGAALVATFVRPGTPCPSEIGRLTVASVASAASARGLAAARTSVFVVGVAPRTPLTVGVIGIPGVLSGGIAARAGVATPYDLAASVLASLGIRGARGVIGVPLKVAATADAAARIDALSFRMLRDASYGPGLAWATAVAGVLGCVIAFFALRRRRNRVAAALARAASIVPAGYVAALFVPSARWEVRAVVVLATFAAGGVWPARNTRRFCGRALVGTAAVVAVLAAVAAMRPDAEPALSLWGDPLNSWRFFGLRNHLAAFVAGGAVAGAALLGVSARVLVVAGLAGAVVVGAPQLGANFVAVFTLVLGAGVAVGIRSSGKVRVPHLAVAGVAAVAGFGLALVADARTPVSHGGRALNTVRSGGARAAWRFIADRAALDYREVASGGVAGFAGFAGVAVVLVALFVWAARTHAAPSQVRAAVAGGAVAAFAALFVEDSGFFTGAILALYPAVAWLSWSAGEDAGVGVSSARAPTRTSAV